MQKRVPQLDGIRGIAILLVMLHNESKIYPSLHLQNIFESGWMGVDLFFVLSGFLITGILLDSKDKEHYFRNFYARRCLRIWPLYYSLIFFMFAILPAVHAASARPVFERSSPWWSYPIFLQNFFVPNPSGAAGPLGVTWSLAVEEQFYLLWPLAVYALSQKQLRRFAIAVICLSPALRLLLVFHHIDVYSNTFSRLDGLMAGVLIASIIRSTNFPPSRFVKPAWVVLLTALPLALVLDAVGDRWIVFSFSAIASACMLFLSLYSPQQWLQIVFRNRFLVYTGRISYGLYLLHKLPFDLVQPFQIHTHPLLMMLILYSACYALAALSWNLLEMPFLNLKKFFEPNSLKEGSAAANGLTRRVRAAGL
jgi:peptidoglycan/LPS O-acetylase OafA/YrhL